MDEAALIKLVKKGDLDAFNRLILAYQDRVYTLAYRMLHSDPAAQDVTQDAFINAYEKLSAFRGGSFKAWILRIAANKCYDELRRWKRRPETELYPTNPENEEEVEDPTWLADDNQSPEDEIEKKELDEAIQSCIDALPDEYKAVVILVDVQGMDYKNASRIVDSPLGTIRSRLARARRRLQDCLHGVYGTFTGKIPSNL